MARTYELKRRAERQEETRRRIAQAALELHSTIGPARTTVSAIADRAGVQRHTFYRHFPDELSLGLACSGLHVERDPPPDPESWLGFDDPHERVRAALLEVYAYYERNEALLSNVIRDTELDPTLVQVMEIRFGPWRARTREVLAQRLPPRPCAGALLDLALDFQAWRRLAASGLSREQAAEAMVSAVRCQ